MTHWLPRLVKHRLFDEGDARRAVPAEALKRIEQRVAASEAKHSGQIRVCIEAGMPMASLRRGLTVRERAVAMFGKLGVWDTEHNNGVLIYLLLAERGIEIVADRGLARAVAAGHWQPIVASMQTAFREGRFEAGIEQAIDAVDALLVANFPRSPGSAGLNELPDAPDVR